MSHRGLRIGWGWWGRYWWTLSVLFVLATAVFYAMYAGGRIVGQLAMLTAMLLGKRYWNYPDIRVGKLRAELQRGCCVACKYDLRGGSEACPECGRRVPTRLRRRTAIIPDGAQAS
jgi:hypothetical protein